MEEPRCCWLVAYADGSRRMVMPSDQRERAICKLPVDGWLARLRKAHGSDGSGDSIMTAADGKFLVVALLQMTGVAVHSLLYPHTKYTRLMWEYYKRPCDGYVVQLDQVFPCSNPVPVHVARRFARDGHAQLLGGVVRIQVGGNGIFWPAEDLTTEGRLVTNLHGGTAPVEAVLNDLGVEDGNGLPALLCPWPVADLVCKRLWPQLLLLARWPCLWTTWPEEEWCVDWSGKHEDVDSTRQLSADRLQSLANDLRRWSTRIISGHQLGRNKQDH